MGWEHSRYADFWNQFHGGFVAVTLAVADAAHRLLVRASTSTATAASFSQRRPADSAPTCSSAMNLELVTIGTELLLGFTVDTNGAEIARALAAIGVRVVRRTAVGDEPRGDPGRRGGGARPHRGRAHHRRARARPATTSPSRSSPSCSACRSSSTRSVWAAAGRALRAARAGAGRRATAARPRCRAAPRCCATAGARRRVSGSRARRASSSCCPACPGRCGTCSSTRSCRGWPREPTGGVIRSRMVRTTGIPGVDPRRAPGRDRARDRAAHAWPTCPGSTASTSGSPRGGCRRRGGRAARPRPPRCFASAAGEYVYGEGEADLAALVLERARAARAPASATAESCTGGLVGGAPDRDSGKLRRLRGRHRRLRQRAQDRRCSAWTPRSSSGTAR